ncbi:MAG TPA: hypothetical protein VLA24_17955 [Pseudomonadales bacterium]|nr:hypothetical protein [Pseudomonadales bacterium]
MTTASKAQYNKNLKRLKTALSNKYKVKPTTERALIVGDGHIKIGGNYYDAQINGGAGGIASVTNIGRPSAAIYSTSESGVISTASGGSTASTGGGSGGVGIDASLLLFRDGRNSITGNIPASAGATVDGVDISAHAIDPDAHHAKQHSIVDPLAHTATGSALDIVGLNATNTLGVLTPSAAPGAASAILKSSSIGDLTLPLIEATTFATTPEVRTASGDLLLMPASGTTKTVGAIGSYTNIEPPANAANALFAQSESAAGLTTVGSSSWGLGGYVAYNAYQVSPRAVGANPSATGNMKFAGNQAGSTQAAMTLFDGNAGSYKQYISTSSVLADGDDIAWTELASLSATGTFAVINKLAAAVSVETPEVYSAAGDLDLTPQSGNVAVAGNVNTTGSVDAMGNINADQSLYAANSEFLVEHHTHGGGDHVHVIIDPAVDWVLDEAFGLDVGGNMLVRGWIVGKHALQLPGAVMIAHFDGATPYATNFEGTTLGHKGQEATVTGSRTFVPGKFAKGIRIADASTNLITNPSFEVDTTGWTDVNATISADTTRAYVGVKCLKIIAADATATVTSNIFTAEDDFGPVGASGVSLWYQKYTSIGGTGKIRIDYYSDFPATTLVSSVELELPAGDVEEWTYAYIQNDPPATSLVGRLVITSEGCTTGVTYYIDGVSAADAPYPVPYADGSMGTGHAWTGTAHASTSTAAASQVRYDTSTFDSVKRKFTVGCWFWRASDSPGYLWHFGDGTSLRIGA